MSNIVVLDEITLTPDQLRRLKEFGNVTIFSTVPSSGEEIVERLADADICILGWTTLTRELLGSLPRLRMIAIWATGTNYVDLVAARTLGIVVTNVPAYAANAVAELCIGFMVCLSRSTLQADRHVRGGSYRWQDFRGTELAGKRLGIVGLGPIGSRLSALARCMGMQVAGFTRYPSPKRAEELNISFEETIENLIINSDFLSLNCALTPETMGVLNDERLGLIPTAGFLINTARAGLIDQAALVRRLKQRSFAGAALDDIDTSVPDLQELYALDNVLLSPHLGFHTTEALSVKSEICIMNVVAYLDGAPINVV